MPTEPEPPRLLTPAEYEKILDGLPSLMRPLVSATLPTIERMAINETWALLERIDSQPAEVVSLITARLSGPELVQQKQILVDHQRRMTSDKQTVREIANAVFIGSVRVGLRIVLGLPQPSTA